MKIIVDHIFLAKLIRRGSHIEMYYVQINFFKFKDKGVKKNYWTLQAIHNTTHTQTHKNSKPLGRTVR